MRATATPHTIRHYVAIAAMIYDIIMPLRDKMMPLPLMLTLDIYIMLTHYQMPPPLDTPYGHFRRYATIRCHYYLRRLRLILMPLYAIIDAYMPYIFIAIRFLRHAYAA